MSINRDKLFSIVSDILTNLSAAWFAIVLVVPFAINQLPVLEHVILLTQSLFYGILYAIGAYVFKKK